MPILNYYPTDKQGRANFEFDHAQAHASLSWAMASPNTFNLQRYLLDPQTSPTPSGNWATDHQQAHDDAATWYGQPSLPMVDETVGSPMWLFTNSTEHDSLNLSALVASQG